MPVGKLDHYSIRTLDVEASRGFYSAVMGVGDPSGVTIELNFPAAEARNTV
jgi:hypothetical protein